MLNNPPNTIMYAIRPRDTLGTLARRYNTTVQELIALNPGIEPRFLRIGEIIIIPGRTPQQPPGTRGSITRAQQQLYETFRLLWEQHGAWTRMAITSLVFGTPDQNATITRLLRNPSDMAAALEPFYGREIARRFERLLSEHLTIAANIVQASMAGDTMAAQAAVRSWYQNADDIIELLSSVNPYWPKNALQALFYKHLEQVAAEANAILARDYARSADIYDEMERHVLTIADTMAEGIIRQFPRRFA